MKKRAQRLFLLTLLPMSLFVGCQDAELTALMDDYCACISESRNDEEKIGECIEKMDAIKLKYQKKPQKLLKVLERTDECN